MLRRVLFVLAGVAAAAFLFLAADRSPKAVAADPEVAGNWLLTTSIRGGTDQALMIIKVEVKDGKQVASVIYTSLKGGTVTATKFAATDKTVKFNTSLNGFSFEGTFAKDGKSAVGNFSSDTVSQRAKLTRTDKTELDAKEVFTRADAPTPVTDAQKLTSAVVVLRGQAQREKDAEKKKELLEKVDAAQKEADEKVPGLLREVVAKHTDTPFALDAAADLLRAGAKYKVTPDEATKLVATVEKLSAPYGERFSRMQMIVVLEGLVTQKGLEPAAEDTAAKLARVGMSAEFLSRVLNVRKTALEAMGKKDEAKAISAEIAKLEERIDQEYMAKVPPFKPAAFAGRKDKTANQVVVMELFTGAQCPPCVAADVAFDALQKAYKPTELVLIQYHLHIPGPDPLTNPDALARAKYYSVNSTPSTFFNGKSAAPGGGGMAGAEGKFKQYTGIINPLLEQNTEVKVGGKASRSGDKIDIAVEVAGSDGEDMKLRLLLVEENVKYVGGNNLRFHHQVVRAMPGGADGVAIKDKAFKHTATADLTDVRKELTKYLDTYAANRPFPKPDRPMDMKALRVIALVQNDKTKEIVQAVQIEVEGKAAGGGER